MADTKPSPSLKGGSNSLMLMRELLPTLGIRSRQAVYDRLRADPTFPRPRRTGAHTVAWVRGEVEAWLQALPVAQFDGQDAIERRRKPECAAS